MNLLSEYNRILSVGNGGTEYSAGENINITDYVISGRDWNDDINSAISSTSGDIVDSAYNQTTAWVDEQGYLTAHQDVSNLPYVQNSALGYNGSLISGISGSGFFAESASSANFLASGWEHDNDGYITSYNNSAFAGGRYTGISPIVVNNDEMKISAKSALLGVQEPLYFVEDSETATVIGIQESAFPTFEGTEDGKVSAINGSAINAATVTEYSAGSNISIDDYVISVTGVVPSANYATESNHAYSADSATYDSLGRNITATYLTAHQDWTDTIQNASGNAYNSAVNWVVDQNYLTAVTGDNTPYSAGDNISITDHVVSGKDWTSEIQAASANAVAQIPDGLMVASGLEYDGDSYITGYSGSAFAGGVEYSGISPIVVNNDEHKISAQSALLGVQSPLYFVTDDETATVIGIQDSYIPYTDITTGESGTTVYNVASGIRVTAASGWVELMNQNTENDAEAHLQVGQNYSSNNSFFSELDGAGGGFLQMCWNSGHIDPNTNPNYSESTTARLDLNNGAIIYKSAAHSLTATGEGGDSENKIWQLGAKRLRFWDSAGNTAAEIGPDGWSCNHSSDRGEFWFDNDNELGVLQITCDNSGYSQFGYNWLSFYDSAGNMLGIVTSGSIANWNSTYNTVQSNSANWGLDATSAEKIIEMYNVITAHSANW